MITILVTGRSFDELAIAQCDILFNTPEIREYFLSQYGLHKFLSGAHAGVQTAMGNLVEAAALSEQALEKAERDKWTDRDTSRNTVLDHIVKELRT